MINSKAVQNPQYLLALDETNLGSSCSSSPFTFSYSPSEDIWKDVDCDKSVYLSEQKFDVEYSGTANLVLTPSLNEMALNHQSCVGSYVP